MINLIRHTNIYNKQYHNCTHVLAVLAERTTVLAERTTVLSAVTCRVARSLVFCVLFFGLLLVLLSMEIVLFILPRLTISDYPFDIFKLFLRRIQVMSRLNDIYNWIATKVIQYDRIYAITCNACILYRWCIILLEMSIYYAIQTVQMNFRYWTKLLSYCSP